jgi:hypothetical protein
MADKIAPLFSDAKPFTGDLTDAEEFQPEPDVAPDEKRTEHVNIIDTPVEPPTGGQKKRRSALVSQLEASYTMLGTGVFMLDPQIGNTIITQATPCAEALDELAQKNPKVKAALNNMLTAGAWSAVITAHLPIAVHVGTKYIPELRRRYSADYRAAQGGSDVAA